MAHYLIKHILYGALCAGAAFSLTSCTDDSYDLDKVDLTMGIGSEGLSATLGTTEKIHLADILEEDKSVKTDAKSLYYMVKSESVNYDFNIKKVTTSINSPELTSRVLNYNAVLAALKAQGGNYTSGQVLPIPANFSATAKADATKASDFQVNFTTDSQYRSRFPGDAARRLPGYLCRYLQEEHHRDSGDNTVSDRLWVQCSNPAVK